MKPKKLILSRKGFDSASGGCPSPIFPDGTMFSLPIPSLWDGPDQVLPRAQAAGSAQPCRRAFSGTRGHSKYHNIGHLLASDIAEYYAQWTRSSLSNKIKWCGPPDIVFINILSAQQTRTKTAVNGASSLWSPPQPTRRRGRQSQLRKRV